MIWCRKRRPSKERAIFENLLPPPDQVHTSEARDPGVVGSYISGV